MWRNWADCAARNSKVLPRFMGTMTTISATPSASPAINSIYLLRMTAKPLSTWTTRDFPPRMRKCGFAIPCGTPYYIILKSTSRLKGRTLRSISLCLILTSS
jgi:hypothetical protein